MIKQFLEFRDQSEEKLKQAAEKMKIMPYLEQALVLKTPVMEAEFAMDDRSPLNLYDCLIPKIREQRRFLI